MLEIILHYFFVVRPQRDRDWDYQPTEKVREAKMQGQVYR